MSAIPYLRALQAFDAATTLIAAQADYFRARANYEAATGDLADRISFGDETEEPGQG